MYLPVSAEVMHYFLTVFFQERPVPGTITFLALQLHVRLRDLTQLTLDNEESHFENFL